MHCAAQGCVLLLTARGSCLAVNACMVLFALIFRNWRIKQEKDDDAPPSPRGPWLRGPWIKLKTYESINAAFEGCRTHELHGVSAHQFSVIVEQFDLKEPTSDSAARLGLPYMWMYECCTLDFKSGFQNDDQLFMVNPSWMVMYRKRPERENDLVKLRVVRLKINNGALEKTWAVQLEDQGERAVPILIYRPAIY